MNRNYSSFAYVATAILLFGGCSALQNMPRDKAGAKLMTINDPACQEEIAAETNSRGMIGLQIRHDYLDGNKIKLKGKAFVAEEEIGISPYTVIGETARPKAVKKTTSKVQNKLTSLGASIEVSLAAKDEAFSGQSHFVLDKTTQASSLRSQMSAAMDPKVQSSAISISLKPNMRVPHFYQTVAEDEVLGAIVPVKPEGQMASTPQFGFMGNRSFIINVPKWEGPVVTNIPGDPRIPDNDSYAKGFEAKEGAITIPIAVDNNRPAGVKNAYLLVQMEELNPKAGAAPWIATCVKTDDKSNAVVIPMKAKPNGATEAEDVKGAFKLSVFRSYVRTLPLDKGFSYVEARSGFTTIGSN